MTRLTNFVLATVVGSIVFSPSGENLSADIFEAATNAEIRVSGAPGTDMTGDPSGIREFAGATSTLFFNVEGSANAPFEVFAVADFTLPAMPAAIDIEPGASLTLFEDPAGFATAGPIEVYLALDSSPGLIDVTANPGPGVPSYQTGLDGFASLDPAFGAFSTMLGSTVFTPTAAGNPNVIPLTFGAAELAHVLSVAKPGGTLRLLVAPGDATVAFTGAGQANGDGPPPTLDISFVVPEPNSFLILAISTGICLIRRRSRALPHIG